MDVAQVFQEALARILGSSRLSLFWNDSIVVQRDGDEVQLGFDHAFLLERLRSRISEELTQAAQAAFGPTVRVVYRLQPKPAAAPAKPVRRNSPGQKVQNPGQVPAKVHSGINNEPKTLLQTLPTGGGQAPLPPRKTMADFLIGPCNQLAAAAAQLVAAQPGAASPLYLHGPTGSGKTHLLEAIRHQYRASQQVRRVVMMTAEEFTNDFMGALQGSGLPGFRRRYRDVESLLVDDIQFLDGKRATIREFQFTVDSLLRAGRQLIFAADRPPMELDGIGSELAGRLAGGMVCGLQSLDQATRTQLVNKLASLQGVPLKRGLGEMIAERMSGDGRLIGGLVCRLKAVAGFNQGDMSWETVTQYAGDLLDAAARTVALADIQKAVCETFNLPTAALQGRGQQQVYSQPRMLAMYLARKYTRAALSEIGEYFGERSHSTVIAANKRVERWLSQGNTVRRGDRAMDITAALQTIERQLRVS